MVVLIPAIGYMSFRSGKAQKYFSEKISSWLSSTMHTRVQIKGIDYSFWDRLVLEKILIEDQQHDTLFYANKLAADFGSLNFKLKTINFDYFEISGSKTQLIHFANGKNNFDFILDLLKKPKPPQPSLWGFSCMDFRFEKSSFRYRDEQHAVKPSELNFHSLNLDVSKFAYYKESWVCGIRNFSFRDQKGFNLTKLKTTVTFKPDSISLKGLYATTPESRLRIDRLSVGMKDYLKKNDISLLKLKLNIAPSHISLADIAFLLPDLKGMDNIVGISGVISGKIGDLRGKKMNISFGRYSELKGNFYANGLPDIKQMFLVVDLAPSSTHLSDIQNVKLPKAWNLKRIPIPMGLAKDAGVLHYEGNFTGYLSDFVAYGTLSCGLGRIESDLSFKPKPSRDINIKGHLRTRGLQIGKILKQKLLGRVNLNGELDGTLTAAGSLIAKIKGNVDSLEVNHQNIRGISLRGDVNHKLFNGSLIVNDRNIDLGFNGKIDYSKKVPQYNFTADIRKAQIGALKFSSDSLTALSGFVQANFVGNNIDNFSGDVQIKNSSFVNKYGSFQVNGLNVFTRTQEHNSQIVLTSDFADAKVEGDYNFSSLSATIKRCILRYLPSCPFFNDPDIRDNPEKNHFNYSLTIKNSDPITKVLLPQAQMTTPVSVQGYVYEDQNDLKLDALFPELKYKDLVFKELSVNASKQHDKLVFNTKAQNINYQSAINITNFTINANAGQDTLNVKMFWNNWGKLSFGGDLSTSTFFRLDSKKARSISDINVKPSKIFIADSVWRVTPGVVTIDSMIAHISDLSFRNKDQEISIAGDVANDRDHQVKLNIKNLNLKSIDGMLSQRTGLGGIVNGEIGISDIFKRPIFYADLLIKRFSIDQENLGDLSLINKWDAQSESLFSRLLLEKGDKKLLDASGSFNPDTGTLDYLANLSQVPTTVLTSALSVTFSDLHGTATGKVHVGGTVRKLLFNGTLYGDKAGLTINVLQVPLTFSDSVRFKDDQILFENIRVSDNYGNSGILNASLRHDNFGNMDVNLKFKTPNLLVLNTSPNDNENFYGKIFGAGVVQITGHGPYTKIEGSAKTMKGSNVYIPLGGSEKITENSFISFVSKKAEKEQKKIKSVPNTQGGVEVEFSVDATPDAKCQVTFDSGNSDKITGTGNGNLLLKLDRSGKLQMFGLYTIESGNYNFSLKNVVNKDFTFQRGGTIKWDGDPSDATVDLNAVLRVNASLYELFMNSSSLNTDTKTRIPVDCKINLTDKLAHPVIHFDLDFPNSESRIVDEIRQYIATEEDMNKQILSLLVLGQFYTPDHLRGTYNSNQNSQNLIGSTASNLLSTQLSTWLSQLSKTWDIGVNYRPGTQVSNDEINFALSHQILNDRVTFNGNFGYNSKTVSSTQNTFIADFDVLMKLTRNGKLQFRVYNQTNNNLIYETSPTTQGIGFIYREDFNSFNELFRLFKAALKNRQK
ncbi:MAG: translocation/assembly module TamB domain-containing protein [Bacteroidota bacterium]|nr:translocation/assembly module TamB domain-containing protein [Bacteroidota bacterium]